MIKKEPIEIDKLLSDDYSNYKFINFSRIIKEYVNYLHFSVGQAIKYCSKTKWLDKRFPIIQQEKDLLFELNRYTEHIESSIKHNLPSVEKVHIEFKIGTASGNGQGDIVKTKELITANVTIAFYQPETQKKYQEFQLEFNYFLNFESEKGWH